MAALNLHHVIFAHEKCPKLPLRSASSFLQHSPESDGSPTSHLFSSTAYQDLIQRQPTHPDGPTTGWDLGLNLLGDPITAAEHKTVEVHQIKMKLRRFYAISVAFELLFGVWGTYTTVRYCLAYSESLSGTEHVSVLVLGIMSALAVTLVIMSTLLPLFPLKGQPHSWRQARSLSRACYLFLLSACAMVNLILVLIQHPSKLCSWDIDVAWYTATMSAPTSACHPTSFAAWITAAIIRLVVTGGMALSFIYTLQSYYGTRRPSEENSPKYMSYLTSDPEELSPVSISSPLHRSKSTFKFTRSQDSNHTLNHSNVTLPKSSSISTLAPSTSCTGHSRSHSTPPSKDITPPRISPPTSRRTSNSTHAATTGLGSIQSGSSSTPSDVPSIQIQQPMSAASVPSPAPYLLRRKSRISITQGLTPDMTSDVASSYSEGLSGPTIPRDTPEIRSGAPWKPSHRGIGVHLDASKKGPMAWDTTTHVRHLSQTSGTNSETFSSSAHDDDTSIDKDRDGLVPSVYGYGASGHTYPYLDMYNPQLPHGEVLSAVSEDTDTRMQTRRVIPCRPAFLDVSSEPRSSLSREHTALKAELNEGDEQAEEEQSSGGEEVEEEYVAMMGGFVRRMATIESLGSKEAAGTLSSFRTGSLALKTATSTLSSASQFSSVRFTAVPGSASLSASSSGLGYAYGFGQGYGSSRSRSGTSSFGAFRTTASSSGHTGSLSTAYLSFSSGGTEMMGVNECGELLPSCHHDATTHESSS